MFALIAPTHLLKYRTLDVIRSGAQPAPSGHDHACESSRSAENPVDKTGSGVCRGSASRNELHGGQHQATEAIENEQRTDGDPHDSQICPGQQHDADGCANRRASKEWPQNLPLVLSAGPSR